MNKPAWLFAQSAVIPFIANGETVEVVLITSSSSGRWGIPKGVIEKNMSPQESAVKEAIEEAGVIGHVSVESIAKYEYEKWNGLCHVEVFTLEVIKVMDLWDEMGKRDRAIVEVTTAIELVKPELKNVLIKFQELYGV